MSAYHDTFRKLQTSLNPMLHLHLYNHIGYVYHSITETSKIRGYWAKEREKRKDSKYHNTPNIMGVGLECMRFMSKNGKKIINYVAERLSLLKNESKSLWVNRIRSNIVAVLMKHNTQMMMQCYKL